VAEVCDGTNTDCPADVTQPSGTACTDDGNPCTTDICDGSSTTCQHPAGNAGTECRPAAGDCDAAESCDGTNTDCTADAFNEQSTVCRPAADACDIEEHCTGSSAACPPDAVKDGNDAIICAFANTVTPNVCQTESVPRAIEKLFTAADHLVSRALDASGRARRHLRNKAIAKLNKALRLLTKAEGRNRHPISGGCASPIRDVLMDALTRVLTLA